MAGRSSCRCLWLLLPAALSGSGWFLLDGISSVCWSCQRNKDRRRSTDADSGPSGRACTPGWVLLRRDGTSLGLAALRRPQGSLQPSRDKRRQRRRYDAALWGRGVGCVGGTDPSVYGGSERDKDGWRLHTLHSYRRMPAPCGWGKPGLLP